MREGVVSLGSLTVLGMQGLLLSEKRLNFTFIYTS